LEQGFKSGATKDQKLVRANKKDPAFVYTISAEEIPEGSGKLRTGEAIDGPTGKKVNVPIVAFAKEGERSSGEKPVRTTNSKNAPTIQTAREPAPARPSQPVAAAAVKPAPAPVVQTRRPMPVPAPPVEPRTETVRYSPPPPPPKSTAEKVDEFFERELQGAAAVFVAPAAYCWGLANLFTGRW
jgi:hypothetical protein